MNKRSIHTAGGLVLGLATLLVAHLAVALGTGFTFQGQLQQSGLPQNGACDFQFSLYDAASGGVKQGVTQTVSALTIQDGLFTATLNAANEFGANPFDGNDRWLELSVRCPAGSGNYSAPFAPRQALTAAPYASYAARTGNAVDVACSGCVGSADLAADSVTSAKIADGTIVTNDLSDSAVTSAKIADATITANDLASSAVTPAKLQPGTNGQVLTTVSGSVAWQTPTGGSSGWSLTGNAATTGSNFLGTTDSQPLELRVNNSRVLRIEQAAGSSPNFLGGSSNNAIAAGVQGGTISGGGRNVPNQNFVYDNFGTVAGGERNRAGSNDVNVGNATYATVGGGGGNSAAGFDATVAGGFNNSASADEATVAGGLQNTASANQATVGGGGSNTASGGSSTVAGGVSNQATAPYSIVAGGNTNTAAAEAAFVGGGTANNASGSGAAIGGGQANSVSGTESFVGGGYLNAVTANWAVIGGGRDNQATALLAVIGGGGTDDPAHPERGNVVYDQFGTIGGGSRNQAGSNDSNPTTQEATTVAGGLGNRALAALATIGGGGGVSSGNTVYDSGGVVVGGSRNSAGRDDGNATTDTYAFVGGGAGNRAAARFATVAGGGGDVQSDGNFAYDAYGSIAGGQANQTGIDDANQASQQWATVGGGFTNRALASSATVAGGSSNTSTGVGASIGGGQSNSANGNYAAVPGGNGNSADGQYSFAAGRQAAANLDGCFVWADASGSPLTCGTANRFVARAAGGVQFLTNAAGSAGVQVAAGSGSWSSVSDRNAKQQVTPVDGRQVLERLAAVPINTWSYKTQSPDVRHIGPMAQDFAAAFAVGEDSRLISNVDADGVALAAIQGLYAMLREKDAELAMLRSRLTALEHEARAKSASKPGKR